MTEHVLEREGGDEDEDGGDDAGAGGREAFEDDDDAICVCTAPFAGGVGVMLLPSVRA